MVGIERQGCQKRTSTAKGIKQCQFPSVAVGTSLTEISSDSCEATPRQGGKTAMLIVRKPTLRSPLASSMFGQRRPHQEVETTDKHPVTHLPFRKTVHITKNNPL